MSRSAASATHARRAHRGRAGDAARQGARRASAPSPTARSSSSSSMPRAPDRLTTSGRLFLRRRTFGDNAGGGDGFAGVRVPGRRRLAWPPPGRADAAMTLMFRDGSGKTGALRRGRAASAHRRRCRRGHRRRPLRPRQSDARRLRRREGVHGPSTRRLRERAPLVEGLRGKRRSLRSGSSRRPAATFRAPGPDPHRQLVLLRRLRTWSPIRSRQICSRRGERRRGQPARLRLDP